MAVMSCKTSSSYTKDKSVPPTTDASTHADTISDIDTRFDGYWLSGDIQVRKIKHHKKHRKHK
jgi:hypothetical protein